MESEAGSLARWDRLAARIDRMSRIDRLLVGCAVTLAAFAPLVWWLHDIDPITHPTFRESYFQAAYAFLCACTGAWVVITGWLLAIRKTRRTHAGLFYVAGILYVASNTLFAFGIGWDTSPWIPLTFFAAGAGGFVWMDTPKQTWAAIAVGYALVVAGVTAEAMGWLPHAYVLASSPNAGGHVGGWWHGLIGLQTLAVSAVLIVIVRYVALLWRVRDREVRERNELLRYMFGRYMSTEVMRTLLDDPEAALGLGGQQREVTLLMSDLRGFTALAEQLTPTETIALLNDYFEVMVEVCLEHRGTINEIIGDALLVVFGAPAAMPDHADRAIACAIAMQRAMTTVNRRNREAGRPDIEMGIGLNTGEVIVGNIGSTKRTKYGVVGSHVNRTARIESYTVGGQVFASSAVLDAAQSIVETHRSAEVHPKGSDAIVIHDIRRIGAPFDLELAEAPAAITPLARPLPVHFATLSGKHGGATARGGELIALGGQRAVLEAGDVPDVFDNLTLTLAELPGETLCAKVVGHGEGTRCTVHFTSMSGPARTHLAARRAEPAPGR